MFMIIIRFAAVTLMLYDIVATKNRCEQKKLIAALMCFDIVKYALFEIVIGSVLTPKEIF